MADQSRNGGRASNHAERLRQAAYDLLRIADELDEGDGLTRKVHASIGDAAQQLIQFKRSRSELLQTASDTYRLRRQRDRHFPASFFGEPAWDILLDLFANDASDRPVSISSACIAASAPASTGIRWLRVLEDSGYIEKIQDRSDSRVTLVVLTDLARTRLADYLSLLPTLQDTTPADWRLTES